MPDRNVLIISADQEIGNSTEHALHRRGYEIRLASPGAEANAFARSFHPDVIVVDVDFHNANTMQICGELRAFVLEPIIVLSNSEDESDIAIALAVGADTVLIKPVSDVILIASIDAAIRRETTYRRRQSEVELLTVKDLTIDLAGCEVRRNGEIILLSPMEFRLMRVLAENAGRALSRDQLLNSVWDIRGDEVYSRTVDVHIGRLRRKIEDDPYRPRYIATVPGVGYKIRIDD